jgi:hypothetical protein
MPTPTDTPSPGAIQPADRGWLVEGHIDYLDASSPVCSDEDLLTAARPEFFGLYLERSGGPPDDWTPDVQYQVDNNGILLDFGTLKYQGSRFDGDLTAGIGTKWETFGTFTFERDAQGVITGGRGTGKTTLLHESGDVEHLSDAMTFTVSVSDEPTWCNIR